MIRIASKTRIAPFAVTFTVGPSSISTGAGLRAIRPEVTFRALSTSIDSRHQYAQTRYRELTGWPAPAAGGPRSRDLTPSQRQADLEARLTISEELGHEREQITAVLGR